MEVSPRVGGMEYVGGTVKDRSKYVVGMGKCVVLCVELCSCMLRVCWGVAKMRRRRDLGENRSSFSCLINCTRTRFAAIVAVHVSSSLNSVYDPSFVVIPSR